MAEENKNNEVELDTDGVKEETINVEALSPPFLTTRSLWLICLVRVGRLLLTLLGFTSVFKLFCHKSGNVLSILNANIGYIMLP